MAIEFRCPCGALLQADEAFAGRKGRCPSCGNTVEVPKIQPDEQAQVQSVGDHEEQPSTAQQEPAQTHEEHEEVDRAASGEDVLNQLDAKEGLEPPRRRRGHTRETIIGAGAVVVFAVILALFLLRGKEVKESTPPARQTLKSVSAPSPPPAAERMEQGEIKKQTKGTRGSPGGEGQTQAVSTSESPLRQAERGQSQSTGESSNQKTPAPSQVKVAPAEGKQAGPPPSTSKEASKEKGELVSEAPPVQKEGQRTRQRPFFSVNVASLRDLAAARELADKWRKRGYKDVFIREAKIPGKGTFHRVSVGRFETRIKAVALAKKFKKEKGIDVFVVRLGTR